MFYLVQKHVYNQGVKVRKFYIVFISHFKKRSNFNYTEENCSARLCYKIFYYTIETSNNRCLGSHTEPS